MKLENIEVPKNNYELTKEEIDQVVPLLKNDSANFIFSKYWIEYLKKQIDIMEKTEEENFNPYRDSNLLQYKAMVVMKENWALYINQLDKLDKKYNTMNDNFYFDISKNKKMLPNSSELNQEEFSLAIAYIKNNKTMFMSFFQNKGMEWVYKEISRIIVKENSSEYDKSHLLALKTIVIIISNKFKSIHDFIIFMEKEKKDDIFAVADLKEQEAIQQAKELIKMKIIWHFCKNPDEDILSNIDIYDANRNRNEKINLWYCFRQKIVDWKELPELTLSSKFEIKATDEEGGKFTKKLVIDKKTNTRWILITSGLVDIDEIEYEDISMINFPTETFFIYREDWKNYAKIFNSTYNVIVQ